MMKPNSRVLDYTALIQDGILTLDDVPQDVKKPVTGLVRYLSGVADDSMVKDTSADQISKTYADGGVVNTNNTILAGEKKVDSNDGKSIN